MKTALLIISGGAPERAGLEEKLRRKEYETTWVSSLNEARKLVSAGKVFDRVSFAGCEYAWRDFLEELPHLETRLGEIRNEMKCTR
jgi:hypothetical protein